MQQEISIQTPDNFKIYGSLTVADTKSDRLVIFVHGFTGHKDEHIFFNGANFFNKKSFDVFRFDLYSCEKDARPFKDQSIAIHGTDITVVKNHFKDIYKKIYLVGHSYGGTSLLFVELSGVSGLVFWDASYISEADGTGFEYNQSLDAYILKDRVDCVVGKKFVEELRNFPDCGEMVSKVSVPMKFITAGEKGNHTVVSKYMEKAHDPKEIVHIEEADHCFNSFASEEKLFNETLEWILKY